MPSESIIIVGAGFSGAVIARSLAEAGLKAHVIEARRHVAGNCHTERDPETGVMVHVYGPHIFHTADTAVWDYVNRFADFVPYGHRVQTTVQNSVYSMPINLLTINQFFDKILSPQEAAEFIAARADTSIQAPKNFEEQALSMIGADLYEAFLKGYTEKQWGCSPRDLPASILKRLPLRFNYDDSYFNHPHQGLPRDGYTALVEAMLDHPSIMVSLNTLFDPTDHAADHVFYTGPLDAYFGYDQGRLGYRTLDFERFTGDGDFQGTPVMNYGDPHTSFTRITEHKHLAPWEDHKKTVCYREFSRSCGPDDIPYYPVRLVDEKKLLANYVARAEEISGVTFAGRLATYRYLDMDVCIREALDVVKHFLEAGREGKAPPIFSGAPMG